MAVYKPTDCMPSGDSFDAINNMPIFIECRVDTNNAVVNGYSLEVFDEENNRIFPMSDEDHITAVRDLKRFFDENFSDYGKGYINLNTGINGSYLKIPFIFSESYTNTGTFGNNVPQGLSNGREYSWKITLYQELVLTESGGWITSVSLPQNEKYYDVVICSGKIIGSTNERIQTALVAVDEDIVNGLVLVDKYIQPVNIDKLTYDPENPKNWGQGEDNNGIINFGIRSLIENYDDIYGHIYPSKSGNNAFSPQDIGPESGNNGFRIYKNGNDPENLGASDKAYEIINYFVDLEIANSKLVYYDYNPNAGRDVKCDGYITISKPNNFNPYDVWVQNESGRVYPATCVQTNTYSANDRVYLEIYVKCNEAAFIARERNMPHGARFDDLRLFFYAQFSQTNLDSLSSYNRWQWIDTLSNPSQSYWKQVYTTNEDPSTSGYKPFHGYPSGSVPDLTIYGKERIIFNHMYTGGAYSEIDDNRKYLGSCYNGIFTPNPSAKKIDVEEGEEPKWVITINWYRTTDANTWGLLLNKVVYIENGSTDPTEDVDGDVFIGGGENAEITIGGSAGIINKTPFMFVSEKPIRLFSSIENNQDDTLTPLAVGTNIYMLSTTQPIGEVLSVYIGDGEENYIPAPLNTWSYIVNSKTVFYTPPSGAVSTDMRVVYKAYREQDYTGVIFYNGSFDEDQNKRTIYIKPFIGITKNMIFKYSQREGSGVLLIDNVNTKYWFIKIVDQYLPATNTKYQICSNCRASDYNQFGLYERPDFDVNIYNSLDVSIDPEPTSFIGDVYNVSTRAFRASVVNYTQDDYILWESCCFNLYSAKNNMLYLEKDALINSTTEKYEGDLNCSFYGLEDKNYYILEVIMMTNTGAKAVKNVCVYANYQNTQSSDNIDISFNNNDLCVEIQLINAFDLIDENIERSLLSVYKREVWYYQDDINILEPGSSFSGHHSTWTLLSKNIKLGSKFKDYCVANNHYYEYAICRDVKTTQGVVEERFVKVTSIFIQYSGWSLTNLHFEESIENDTIRVYTAKPADVWRFRYNVSSGAQIQNISRTQQDTLSSHPIFSVGEKNFMNGNVSCLIGRDILPANYLDVSYRYNSADSTWNSYIEALHNIYGYTESLGRYTINQNGNYAYMNPEDVGFKNLTSNESVDVINAWNNFVFSDSPKLLKDEKGRMFIVQLSSNSIEPNNSWPGIPTQISFDWVEVSDNTNIRVVDNAVDGVIEIDGNSLDGGVLPALYYVDFNGIRTVEISNISKITEFGNDAFKGCTGIEEVLIKYDPDLQQGTTGCLPGFAKWCSIQFDNNNSNPIHVSNGRGGNGVVIKYQLESGEYEICKTFGTTNTNLRSLNAMNFVPTQYSVNGYKFLLECNINTSEDIGSASSPGIFEGSGLVSAIISGNTRIRNYSFKKCDRLKSVIINDGVYSIQGEAFMGCSSLPSISLPENIFIGQYAFRNCDLLKEISFGSNVQIGEYAFCGCNGLTNLTIPSGVHSIGQHAFEDCMKLKKINIGNVERIGLNAFANCPSIEDVTIPFVGWKPNYNTPFGYIFSTTEFRGSVRVEQNYGAAQPMIRYLPASLCKVTVTGGSINTGAFENCSMIKEIILPSNSETIAEGAFSGCSSLEEITIPFVGGEAGKTASDHYQYPFGYIFGEEDYDGSVEIEQICIINDELVYTTYYIPSSLKSVIIANENPENILLGAFFNCTELISVTIGNSITSIGLGSFYNCSGLTSVDIGNGVTSIGDAAFYGCSGLTSIVVSDGNAVYHSTDNCLIETTSNTLIVGCNTSVIPTDGSVTRIEEYAFYDCSGLTLVVIPDTVTSIGDGAFSGCSGLTSVTIPDSVTSIGDDAFSGCSKLTSVTIPDSVASIGSSVFSECTGLTSVTIGNSVTDIGDYAFAHCAGLTSVTIPGGVTNIGANAFEYCAGLTSVIIQNGVTSIGWWAFYNCSGLTSVTIPNSVTSIGTCAFGECASLTSVIIPNSVTNIGQMAFSGCSGLTSVEIPNSVTSIEDDAFSGCSKLTSVTIPDSVTSIEDSVFYGCSSLTSVTIPNSVTSIGLYAFRDCTGLTSITIPDSVTKIEFGVFENCSGLSLVNIHSGVTEIGGLAFYGCSSLTGITIPNSVTKIGRYAFAYCTGLVGTLIIPYGVNSIGEGAFYNCSGLTAVTLPYTVTKIADRVFCYCTGLTSAVLPDGLTEIGEYAFSTCSSLTAIQIPDDVTSVGKYAFSYCDSLMNVHFGYNVTSIGEYAFCYCSGLTTVTIPNSVTSIGARAFFYCSAMRSATIGNGVDTIGVSAFGWCDSLEDFTVKPSTPPQLDGGIFSNLTSALSYIPLIYVPSGSVNLYKNAPFWTWYAEYIHGANI